MLRLLSSLFVLIGLPVAALWATAQTTPAASGYTVRGTVVNAVTNQAIARALVAMNQDTAMLTDSNGQFAFENLAPGSYSVSVSKPGFRGHGGFRSRRIVQLPARPMGPVEIQVGPDTPALTITLTPLATIVGRVTLSTADPADNIRLQILARGSDNGHPHWNFAGQTRTRSDGSFRIANLEPGSYMVTTMASLDRPGQALNGGGPIWGYPALYYPGVTDPAAAGVLNLGAGQQAEADITVVRQQFFPVTALVHSSADTPANFEIHDSGGRQSGIPVNYDRREGIVRAAVPNGTWEMEGHVYGRSQEWGSTTFQVNGAPVSLAIGLQTIPHVPIVVRRDFQASADGTQLASPGPGMNISLVPAGEMNLRSRAAAA